MKRKTFIQMGSLFAASPLLPSLSDYPFQDRLQNWAGNITYSTNRVYYPKTLSEMQSQVKQCDRMRGLGTRHCFNTIANSSDNLVSSNKMNNILSLDTVQKTVTVEAGITYGALAPYLHQKGFALHNL